MKHFKTYTVLVVSLLALIVIIQNVYAVRVTFLFWDISMSLALLLPLVLLAGVLIGYVAFSVRHRR